MAKLRTEVQRFIVCELARWRPPSAIVRDVRELFKVEVSRQQVHHYHPDHGQPAEQWAELFQATRKAVTDALAAHGVALQGFRFQELQRLYDRAEQAGNVALAADLLRQAAMEAGGRFTNVQKVGGDASGDPLALLLASVDAAEPTNIRDARKILRTMGIDG